MPSTTTIRVSAATRERVSRLAHQAGLSQTAYLDQLVARQAREQAEREFWARMEAAGPDPDDERAALHEQEAAAVADLDEDDEAGA